MLKGAQELKDLDVDRVDAVDKPATARSFLLFKSEDGNAEQILRGYGMVATAADLVLKAIRKDKNAVVSRKSAIALNGLAQVLNSDAVFVGKSVPTQPYQFSEPDADKRGPADENLGGNFTPRAMPGSMVGSVQFRMKDEDEEDAKSKTAKAWPPKKDDDADEDADEDDAKAKAAAKAEAKVKAESEDATAKANSDIARAMDAQAKSFDGLAKAICKAMGLEQVDVKESVSKGEEKQQEKPRSRQIDEDDQPVRVRKGSDSYEPRLRTSFGNIVFGGK